MREDLATQLEESILGESAGRIPLSEREEHRLASLCLARQAHRRLSLFTYDLDAPVYDQLPFIDAVKALAIHGHQAQIRIMLQDNKKVQQEGHRLLDLCHRLPSLIELRRPPREYLDHPVNFLVVDGTGYIQRELYERYEGFVDFKAPLEARHLEDFFNGVWEHSEPDSEIRRLSL